MDSTETTPDTLVDLEAEFAVPKIGLEVNPCLQPLRGEVGGLEPGWLEDHCKRG